MGLFNPPAPAAPTPTQLAQRAFAALTSDGRQLLRKHAELLVSGWKFVWQNAAKLTPQQACDVIQAAAVAAGSTAAAVFADHAAGVTFVNGLVPGSVPTPYAAVPAGMTVTVNPDGSVTVADAPAPAPDPQP